MFCAQLHNILGRDISTVNLVFRCRDPETGASFSQFRWCQLAWLTGVLLT